MTLTGFRKYHLVCAALLHLSCASNHESPPVPPPESTAAPTAGASSSALPRDTLTIVSNTQATLDDVNIGAGNFWEGEYEGAGGRREVGRTSALWISVRGDPSGVRSIRVGPGTKFTAGRFSFEVLEVTSSAVRINYSPPL